MLCNYFLQRYPYVIVPPLPEKHSLLNYAPIPKVGKEEHLIVEKRKRMLVSFLLRVSIHPVLGKDHIFHRFLENSEPLETICNQEGFPFKVQSKSVASNIISTVVSLTFGPSPPDGTNGNVEVSNRRVEAVVNNIVKTQKLMMKQYQDLSANMIELAGCLNALSLEEDEIGSLLEAIGGSIQGSQTELSTMVFNSTIIFLK